MSADEEAIGQQESTDQANAGESDFNSEKAAGAPKSGMKNYDLSFKKQVIEYAEQVSNHAAAAKFKVDRKRVKEWKKDKEQILETIETGEKKRKKLKGGGRKPSFETLEAELYEWFKQKRVDKQRVTRNILTNQAKEIHKRLFQAGQVEQDSFQASRGWLQNFMQRYKMTLRMKTTNCQKPPADYVDKIAQYIIFVRKLRISEKYPLNCIYAADETAVWIDAAGSTTVEHVGVKEVPVRSTGHDKMRITAMLCARADGSKCRPYVLLPRKQPIPEIDEKFGNKLVVKYCGTNWMDNELTMDFLHKVVGASLFGQKRLLCWDSAKFHISDDTKKGAKTLGIHMAVIPGGCTGFIQAPDVCWNKPFKGLIQEKYDDWIQNGQKEYTKGGNLKPPSWFRVCEWVYEAWLALKPDMIQKSFQVCGVSNAIDGSEDNMITCFKPDGKCPEGAEILAEKNLNLQTEVNQNLEEISEISVVEDEEETRRNEQGESSEESEVEL